MQSYIDPFLIPNFMQTFRDDRSTILNYYTERNKTENKLPDNQLKSLEYRTKIAVIRIFTSVFLGYNALKTFTNLIVIVGAPVKFAESPVKPLLGVVYRVGAYLFFHDIFKITSSYLKEAKEPVASTSSNSLSSYFSPLSYFWGESKTEVPTENPEFEKLVEKMIENTFYHQGWTYFAKVYKNRPPVKK